MGRAFEYRKATKLKRWGHMARTFTKLGKEITIAAIIKVINTPNRNDTLAFLCIGFVAMTNSSFKIINYLLSF